MGVNLFVIFVIISIATLLGEAQLPPEEQRFMNAFSQSTNVREVIPDWTPDKFSQACKLLVAVIKCDPQGHFTFLKISDEKLEGVIPAEIGLLTSLTYLDFMDSNLRGTIPNEIGNLIQLSILALDQTLITGSLPQSILQLHNLQTLLFPPHIRSTIPENIGDLSNLNSLILLDNFYGIIPESIGNLDKLTFLYLNSNFKGSELPATLNELTNLQYLGLVNNNLQGTVPGGFSGLTNLEVLIIEEPGLRGDLHISAFSKLYQIDLTNTALNMCGCFSVSQLRSCKNLDKSVISCSCTLPAPCLPINCTDSNPCGTF